MVRKIRSRKGWEVWPKIILPYNIEQIMIQVSKFPKGWAELLLEASLEVTVCGICSSTPPLIVPILAPQIISFKAED